MVFRIFCVKLKLQIKGRARKAHFKRRKHVKIELYESYSTTGRLLQLEKQLAETEEILKTPQRTVEDIIRHMQILKEIHSLIY